MRLGKIKLIEVIGKQNHVLNVLRFICAIMVIVAHAYTLSLGANHVDFLGNLTNDRIGLGSLAVAILFFSSGLLVSKSLLQKKDCKQFIKGRVLRIFPPLILTVIITVFVLGVFITKLDIMNYLSDMETYKYLLNGILIPVKNLPGVFEGNVFSSAVNGALWTLPVEFACYMILLLFFKLKLANKVIINRAFWLAIISFLLINYAPIPALNMVRGYTYPVYMFYLGVWSYINCDKITLNTKMGVLFFILFILTIVFNIIDIGMFLLFPYIFLTVIYYTFECTKKVGQVGKLSYGVYLCGFPIQQTIVYAFGGAMSPYLNMLISIPIAIVVGYIIYCIAEKPI